MFFAMTDRIRDGLKPYYLFAYRASAFLAISGSLLFLMGWAWIMIFFIFSTSWIAPTILSTTSDKMLQFQGGYLTVAGQQAAAQVGYNTATRQITFLEQKKTQLEELLRQSDLAIKAENAANSQTIAAGRTVAKQRDDDKKDNEQIRKQLAEMKRVSDAQLAAGLITRDTAIQHAATIQQFNNSIADANTWALTIGQSMGELDRRRSTLSGNARSVEAMQSVKAYADIKQSLLQVETELLTAADTVAATKRQLDLANTVMATLANSAYTTALTDGSNLAFIPYDNQKIAVVGAPVYDCALAIIVCHKVGTIRKIYRDEQVIDFPLFNIKLSRTVRGFMVALDVTDKSAMSSSVLFVNKPLFF